MTITEMVSSIPACAKIIPKENEFELYCKKYEDPDYSVIQEIVKIEYDIISDEEAERLITRYGSKWDIDDLGSSVTFSVQDELRRIQWGMRNIKNAEQKKYYYIKLINFTNKLVAKFIVLNKKYNAIPAISEDKKLVVQYKPFGDRNYKEYYDTLSAYSNETRHWLLNIYIRHGIKLNEEVIKEIQNELINKEVFTTRKASAQSSDVYQLIRKLMGKYTFIKSYNEDACKEVIECIISQIKVTESDEENDGEKSVTERFLNKTIAFIKAMEERGRYKPLCYSIPDEKKRLIAQYILCQTVAHLNEMYELDFIGTAIKMKEYGYKATIDASVNVRNHYLADPYLPHTHYINPKEARLRNLVANIIFNDETTPEIDEEIKAYIIYELNYLPTYNDSYVCKKFRESTRDYLKSKAKASEEMAECIVSSEVTKNMIEEESQKLLDEINADLKNSNYPMEDSKVNDTYIEQKIAKRSKALAAEIFAAWIRNKLKETKAEEQESDEEQEAEDEESENEEQEDDE